MKEQYTEKMRNTIYLSALWAALLTGVLFVVVCLFSGITPSGRHIFLCGDGLVQLAELGKLYVGHLFGSDGMQYSFQIGLGMPTSAIYAYYTLSPFTLLYQIISDIDVASFCIVILKQMTAAYFMSVLLQKWTLTEGKVAAFLATAYALCGFFANFFTVFLFLDVMYLCPILILTMLYFFRTGNVGPMVLSYAASFIIQFYSAYIMSVFSVIVFVTLAVGHYGKDFRKWGKSVVKYGVAVIIAVLLSAPVTIPAAMELLMIRGNNFEEATQQVLSVKGFLLGLYPGIGQGTQNTMPMLYTGLPILLLTLGYFIEKRETIGRKLIMAMPLLFLLLCSIWKPAYIMIHAFDQPNGYAFRFSWAVSFWLVLLSGREITNLKNYPSEDKKYVRFYMFAIVCGGGYIILRLFGASLIGNGVAPDMRSSSVTIVLLCFLYIFLWRTTQKNSIGRIVLGLFFCIELMGNLWLSRHNLEGRLSERGYYELWQEQAETSMEYIHELERQEPSKFYRIRYYNCITDNISMLYDYHGLGSFVSIENTALRELLKNYGYATSQSLVFDYGSTRLMQMIFGQKYSVECGYFEGTHPENFTVYPNEYTLPLGFMVEDSFADYQTTKNNPFLAQNDLISSMTGVELDVYKLQKEDIMLKPENVKFDIVDGGTHVTREIPGKYGNATFMLADMGTERIYGYMSRWGKSMVTHAAIPLLYSDLDVGGQLHRSMVVMPHIIPMAKGEDGLYKLYLQMPAEGPDAFDYENIWFAGENETDLKKAFELLQQGGWQIRSFSDQKIIGTVSVKEGKSLLYTSIPYDKGWEVYVDGAKSETMPVWDEMFLAVSLAPGEHEIRLYYHGVWNRYGWWIGIVGGIVYAGLLLWEIRGANRKEEK